MQPKLKQIQIKEGFYPSIIYLPVPKQLKLQPFVLSIQKILQQSSLQYSPILDFHVSLTKNFYPIYSQINQLVEKIKKDISNKIIRLPVVLLLRKIQILQNFVTAVVENITAEKLTPIVRHLQKTVQEPFYESPIFHVSLFKINSFMGKQILDQILSVAINPKKSYSLNNCIMKAGKAVYKLN